MLSPIRFLPQLAAIWALASCAAIPESFGDEPSVETRGGHEVVAEARAAGAAKCAAVELARAERKLALASETHDRRLERRLLEEARLDAELALAKARAFAAERATSEAWRESYRPIGAGANR